MKQLKFAHNLVKEILEGRKNVTWRLFDDKNLQIGDKLNFIDSETGEEFAKAEIIEIKEKKLGNIEDVDFEGHEKFENKEEMLKQYQEYYGDRVVFETIVKIIKFKLV
jgi:hypothetical protein